ncbi:DUF6894 family protein [Brevundimonas sp.]|uniref:DUF6894 family protein n=1 Tax=Brevundimonas sp. TaxID=1871086 RepID=UPI002D715421|nr:hypothetical protein [Brevundimonas sp.]HYD28090.1 hypothetical protein [Brevundimonas sp.]
MPRYFFDITSEHAVQDEDGEELASSESARDVAIRIAAEVLPVHSRQLVQTGRVAVSVRDERGVIVHELECRLTSRSPAAR